MPKVPKFSKERRYDWKSMLKNLPRTFTKGKDYDCQDLSFMLQARNAARVLERGISVSLRNGSVVISKKKGV